MQTEFKLSGEYYLSGVHEVASGFKINNDKTFNFFFMYGALDRYGNGNWENLGNQVIFQSEAWKGSDYKLVRSEKTNSDRILIEILSENKILLQYVFASLDNGKKGSWRPANKDGIIVFEKIEISTVCLALEFCPERFSSIPLNNPDNNYFQFTFEPWIFEYFFNDFCLTFENNALKGKHPLIGNQEFLFVKH